jgi:transcriptional regulator with XRE-family HTH domain
MSAAKNKADLRRLAALGSNITRLREEAGQTKIGLSEAIGMSRKFLADVEAGDRNISVERLFDIADHFGVPPAVLLENIK